MAPQAEPGYLTNFFLCNTFLFFFFFLLLVVLRGSALGGPCDLLTRNDSHPHSVHNFPESAHSIISGKLPIGLDDEFAD